MSDIRDAIRNQAAASAFKTMNGKSGKESALKQMRNLTDSQLDIMAAQCGIPEEHKLIYRAMIRGEDNILIQKMKSFVDTLRTGDLILMCGSSARSKALRNTQKSVYRGARSSHVAVVHADFICIDAIPDVGVTNRLISEVLHDASDDWRVIRIKDISDEKTERMLKVCAYYLNQPYKIFPKRKPAKKYSYCSELARKVYLDCGMKGTGIPSHALIKPCDFDRIADKSNCWDDVTASVTPFVEFCIEYEAMMRVASRAFIDGLKLNRSRFDDRVKTIRTIRAAEKNGKISSEKASNLIKEVHESERKMNFNFWDVSD